MQSVHALADFAIKHEEQFKAWQLGSNYLCCLETTLDKITRLIDLLELLEIKFIVFREPDIDNQITAIAVESLSKTQHKKLFKNLKLAT